MCNRYQMLRQRAEVAAAARAELDLNNNQPPMPGIHPDYAAPVAINADGRRVLKDMRWGMPGPKNVLLEAAKKRADKLRAKGGEVDFEQILRMEPDKGVTNVRNTASSHWKRWLGPENRCLVPLIAFAEPDQDHERTRRDVWFALADDQPLAFFAGIWTPWTSVRKIKEGEVTCDLYGFLTTESAEPVKTYHAKAMPVILTTEADRDLWMSGAPWAEVAHLQRPLPDQALTVIKASMAPAEALPTPHRSLQVTGAKP